MNKQFIKLRPHHLLCLQKFVGYGYDDAFTRHTAELVSALTKGNASVEIVDGCDDVCRVCPNNNGEKCAMQSKTNRMDGAVLKICDLSVGDVKSWDALAAMTKKRIFETSEFERVCGDCQWFSFCHGDLNAICDF